MHITIGDFLIRRLKEVGITEIIGVPGDFNLSFLEQIRDAEGIRFIGACNELNAAYAADGYARTRGVGALLTTYGVGELSALNGIAGSRAEHVPVISIGGAPPQYATEMRWNLHHSLADGDFANMLEAMSPFTQVTTRIYPANAVEEIDRAILTCLRDSRPVHIQVPSDITHLTIEAPDSPLDLSLPASDPERLASATDALLARLEAAQRPLILVDQDTDRHKFTSSLLDLINKAQIPFAQLASGKAILSEQHPLFVGTYNGAASAAHVREAVETADFLITTNPRFIELNSGSFTHKLPEDAVVNLGDQHVNIAGEFYVGISTRHLLELVVDRAPARPAVQPVNVAPAPGAWNGGDEALSHEHLWPRFAQFLEEGDVVIAEAGTSNIGLSPQRMPAGIKYINSGIWGSIGFTLPCLLGSQLADRSRRHILFIGDGSFQLTAQELSTILREELAPIIVLVNNRGYTIERYILGMEDDYNDIQNWSYGAMPTVFKPDTTMVSYSAATQAQLDEALADIAANPQRGAFLEVHLDPADAPAGLKAFGPLTAEFDYGPRGPRNP